MFQTVPLSIIRSFSLYTQQWYMSYRFADSLQAASWQQFLGVLLCVQWKTPDDGQRNCPKHVEFYSKNKFEKLVHLVGFIIRSQTQLHLLWKQHICFYKVTTCFDPKWVIMRYTKMCTIRLLVQFYTPFHGKRYIPYNIFIIILQHLYYNPAKCSLNNIHLPLKMCITCYMKLDNFC